LDNLEDYYIKKWETKVEQNGYNLVDGGSGSRNPSDETRERMSLSHIGKMTGENNPFYGKKHTQETLDRISGSLKGRFTGENHSSFGKVKSLETIKKMSEAQMGRISPRKGVKLSKEQIAKMVILSTGRAAALGAKHKNASSVYHGVAKRGNNKFRSSAIHKGIKYNLGEYDNEEDAALAHDIKSIELWGEKAVLNNVQYDDEMERRVRKIMDQCEMNKEKLKNKSSDYFGVYKYKNNDKWTAKVHLNGERVYVGIFLSETEAALAVNHALLEFYGYKAQSKLNIIPQSEIDLLWLNCTDPTNELP
jgi:group I intron endonuclease